MINNQHITVIIPALNEAASIGQVLAELPPIIDQIIVVNNGSTDATREVAEAAGAIVYDEPERGYGAACLCGIRMAGATDLLAFVDADYSDYPNDLRQVITPVALGDCDLCVGVRRDSVAGKRAILWHQKWGNWFLCRVIGVVHGYCYQDFGPMRCIRGSTLNALGMCDRDYGWTAEMQLKASRVGARLLEVAVGYKPRIGKSKISGTVKGSVMAAYKILFWTFRVMVLPK